MGESLPITAAELQRNGVLGGIEVQMPRHVAEHQRPGGDHLGVQPRAGTYEPEEVAAVAVGPVHHGGDAKPVARVSHISGACACQAIVPPVLEMSLGGRFSRVSAHSIIVDKSDFMRILPPASVDMVRCSNPCLRQGPKSKRLFHK